jgi:hypothetical protein
MLGNYWLLNELAKDRQAEMLRYAQDTHSVIPGDKKGKASVNIGRVWLLLKSIF